jgi:hypothetical protein
VRVEDSKDLSTAVSSIDGKLIFGRKNLKYADGVVFVISEEIGRPLSVHFENDKKYKVNLNCEITKKGKLSIARIYRVEALSVAGDVLEVHGEKEVPLVDAPSVGKTPQADAVTLPPTAATTVGSLASSSSVAIAPLPRERPWDVPEQSGYSSVWSKFGAIDVRIASLSITKVPIVDFNKNITESKNPMFVVVVEVRKNTPGNKRELTSWQRYRGKVITGSRSSVIYLAGDKELSPVTLSGGKLHAGLPELQLIPDDGTVVRDILLFSIPSDDAGELRLRLDAERCGERGDIWFTLPASSWKKK